MQIGNVTRPKPLWWSIAFLALSTQAAVGYGEDDPNQQIHVLVQQLSAESSANARDALANKIADVVWTTSDKTQLRDEAIDEIAGLLSHEDVMLWSASALGQMGPAAERAVPSLEAALDRELAVEQARVFGTGIWPSDVICAALKKIDGVKRSKCLMP